VTGARPLLVRESVGYTLQSLTIHLELGSRDTGIDLYLLGRQRRSLGARKFGRVLAKHLNRESATSVIRMIDEYEARDPQD
jgi:hypothetical protein